MTIQISVVIWTVICFILMMIILNNLLYKPMLELMDKRRSRIDAARAKKAEYDRLCKEHEELCAQKQTEHEENCRRLIKESVEAVRNDQKKAIEAAKDARLQLLDDYRSKTEADEEQMLSNLKSDAHELAIMLADSIVKG